MKNKYLQKDKKQDKKYLFAMVEVNIWNWTQKETFLLTDSEPKLANSALIYLGSISNSVLLSIFV